MITMNKPARIAVIGAAIVAAVMALMLTVLLTWDWDRSRPWLNDKVSQAIGRDFAIRGHLNLSWHRPPGDTGWRSTLPWPRFTASDVVITNPDWARQPNFAALEQIDVDIALLPLLRQQIAIPSITLVNPAVDLERRADGSVNWILTPPADTPSAWTLTLDQIRFASGTVALTDQLKKIDAVATIRPAGNAVEVGALLDKDAPAVAASTYGFAFDVSGTYNKAAVKGSGKFGGVLSLTDTSRPFPLQTDLRVGDSHIVLDGTITDPGNLAALDLQLQLASGSMAHLYPLTGVALPDTPPFSTSGHLTGRLRKSDSVFRYEQFTGKVGGSDLAGTLTYSTAGARPKLAGAVRSERLLFADLAPLVGASKTAAPSADVRLVPGRAIPVTPFRTDRWKAMDADVKFVGKQIIRDAALPVNDVSAHVIMNDGVLTLDPLAFGVAGGTLTGKIALDGSADPLRGKFTISARGLRLKQLFPSFEPMKTSFGQVNGDASLAATGNTPAALAATLDGELRMLLNDGVMSGTLLEQAGLNVANIVVGKLFGDTPVKINCAAAEFIVRKGVLDSRVFALDTTDALINVDGTVNLGTEHLDLNVHPQTKGFRVFSLRSPLYVKGTFKNPQVGVAMGALAVRGAAVVGLGLLNPFAALLAMVAPSDNSQSPCPTIIADANKRMK
ncbi:AsmA family protein [Actimicrobium sp. CCI2.3]|uniref:AsmA family protein n=1 Tax=Actimicrobium sp. CCI2.3 TaxID=3048616 RepID=UPI002AB47A56|nr:AsmA family protein [Actimicrobium sp. CCI2.3]MDY7573144.1 AsmA family protein [Actimicrobium sp. CCI2.3]MEB0022123.1 AsmA family protein [Actimicrobium sp. CCI2.3]